MAPPSKLADFGQAQIESVGLELVLERQKAGDQRSRSVNQRQKRFPAERATESTEIVARS